MDVPFIARGDAALREVLACPVSQRLDVGQEGLRISVLLFLGRSARFHGLLLLEGGLNRRMYTIAVLRQLYETGDIRRSHGYCTVGESPTHAACRALTGARSRLE